MKLWEYDHPYYMSDGCYYQSGCIDGYDSFDQFLENWGKQDVDLNRIHRWDFSEDRTMITFFYVMQRKGYTYSVDVKISEADEPRIKAFLKPHAETNFKLWEGVLDNPQKAEASELPRRSLL